MPTTYTRYPVETERKDPGTIIGTPRGGPGSPAAAEAVTMTNGIASAAEVRGNSSPAIAA